jgi:hypothetical protein
MNISSRTLNSNLKHLISKGLDSYKNKFLVKNLMKRELNLFSNFKYATTVLFSMWLSKYI